MQVDYKHFAYVHKNTNDFDKNKQTTQQWLLRLHIFNKKTNIETTQYTQFLLSSMLIRLNDTELPLQLVSYNKHSQPT